MISLVESWTASFYVIFQKSLETILKNIGWPFSLMSQNFFSSGVRVISEEDDPTPVDLADIEAATLSDPGKKNCFCTLIFFTSS